MSDTNTYIFYIKIMEETIMKNNKFNVISQCFYGNRVETELTEKDIDMFILGILDERAYAGEKIDRTMVKFPSDNNLYLVYNKYSEMEAAGDKRRKPTAIISELGMTLYSRVIACRLDDNGEFTRLKDGDYEKIIKYLTK